MFFSDMALQCASVIKAFVTVSLVALEAFTMGRYVVILYHLTVRKLFVALSTYKVVSFMFTLKISNQTVRMRSVEGLPPAC